MNAQNPPFMVSSKIFKSPRSTNSDEPAERIIKVTITINDLNSNNNNTTPEKLHSNQDHRYTIANSIRPVLIISSSYVRESPPINEQKKSAILKPKAKLVEQVTQLEEKIDQDELEYTNNSNRQRRLGPPTFNSPQHKNSFNSRESIEKDDLNSSSESLNDSLSKPVKTEQRKRNANIFSRTTRNGSQNSQSSSLKQEQNQSTQLTENFNLDQIKRETNIKTSLYGTQQISPKKFSYSSNKIQNKIQKKDRVINQKLYQKQEQEPFYDNFEENSPIDDPPKVPIIFRSHKTNKPVNKKRPYFSTNTAIIQNEKTEKPKKFDRTEKKINRKLLRIPTVNDDLPIFHEDPPEAINKNEEPLIEEEDEDKETVSFVPITNNRSNNDNIRHKADIENLSPPSKIPKFDFNYIDVNDKYANYNDENIDQNTKKDVYSHNEVDNNKKFEFFNYDNIDVDDHNSDNFNYEGLNENNKFDNFEADNLDENPVIDNFNTVKFDQNKNSNQNQMTNLNNMPDGTFNENLNELPQKRMKFSKIENQVIFDENPNDNYNCQNDFINQEEVKDQPILSNKQMFLDFDSNQIPLDLGSEPLIPIKPPTNQIKKDNSNFHQENEKVINVNFDDVNPGKNSNFNNPEISKDNIDQTQIVLNTSTKNEVSINFSPIQKRTKNESFDENNQISSLVQNENEKEEDKKDDNFWMFIPIDKKKHKKETNITQNMSKVLNVSRNYVKGVQNFRSLSMLLNQHRYEHFIMNLDKENQNLVGIYTLNDRMTQIKKIWGDGPEKATINDINSSLIYNPSNKKFSNLDPSFNQDIDAVYLK